MYELSETGRISIVSLFRKIIQNNPPIEVLNLYAFSSGKDRDDNIGELVLETLLSSNIDTISDLNLVSNSSWFKHPVTYEERSSNLDLLVELISKQTGPQHLYLSNNYFSSNATKAIITRIAEHPSTFNKF